MATYYFKVGTGEPFTDKTDAGDDAVAKGQAVKTTSAPASVEAWRMKYNFTTNSVDVYEDGKSNDDALAAKKTAIEAKMAEENTALKAAQVALDAADA
jgi:hypothetical protein|tara:strand:+ start:256 stop:549 length:294 start_codon:yes stop_codon:yes gene_type:complete